MERKKLHMNIKQIYSMVRSKIDRRYQIKELRNKGCIIGNNVALSLGMVGALSIVRFRTAIKDSRDTVYIFWAIIVGICCGVGDYTVAAIGSIAVFVITILLGRVKNDERILLIIRAGKVLERNIESIVFKYFDRKAILKVKNTTQDSVEFIYELSGKTYNIINKKEKNITDILYELGTVEYVNIVTQIIILFLNYKIKR